MVMANYDADDTGPTTVRLRPDLRKALKRSASENHRSLNAEISARLEASLGIKHGPTLTAILEREAQAKANMFKPSPTAEDSAARNNYPVDTPSPDALHATDRAMLEVFRRLPAEKQLALLSLLR